MFSQPEKNLEQFGIDPGSTVADLGSGAGHYSIALLTMVEESGTVYAIDVQQELLAKLKTEAEMSGHKHLRTIWADFEEENGSTMESESVDRVIISNTLFQLEDKDAGLREAYRILKKGGRFLLIDWTDSFSGLGPQPGHVIAPTEGRRLAEKAGFAFDKDIITGEHHYGISFKKQ